MLEKSKLNQIKELIEKYENIILFHHVNPDGDCIATSFGLAKALMNKYPTKNIKVVADIEDFTPHLRYMDKYLDWDKTITSPEHSDYLAIIGDVSNENRVRMFESFKESIKATIVYDHHLNEITVDNVDVFWREGDYPAAALMAYEITKGLEIELDPISALVINHGILTDTGWYKFAPGNKNVLSISSNLNEIIGEKLQKELYTLMSQKTIEDIKFQGWVLDSFKILENKVAYALIEEKDLKRFNLKPEQAAKVNFLLGIKGIESWLFFIQYPDFVRVEFRSLNIPVNEVATKFGGGGHHNASGCKLSTMDEHIDVINEVLRQVKLFEKNNF